MEGYLRMKDIIAKTGIPKSTVLHYISLGLLPEPLRTAKNMSYYPTSYLNLLTVIRTLQSKYRLPLRTIKQIFDRIRPAEISVGEVLHIWENFHLDENKMSGQEPKFYNREEFLAATGLTAEELAHMEDKHLLMPLENNVYNDDDLMAANAYLFAKNSNISVESLDRFVSLIHLLADEVHKIYHKAVNGLAKEKEWDLTRNLNTNLKIIQSYLIRRFIYRQYLFEDSSRPNQT